MSNLQRFLDNGGLVPQPTSNEECGICKEELDDAVRIDCHTPLCRPPVCCRSCTTTFLTYSASCLYCRQPMSMVERRVQNPRDFPFGHFGIEAIHYYAGVYTDTSNDDRDVVATVATRFRDWARIVPLLASPNPDAPTRLDPDILIDVLFSCANAHLQTFQTPEQAQPVIDAFAVLVPCILDALQEINDELLGDTMTQGELEQYLFYMIFTRDLMLRDGDEFFGRFILPAIEDGPPPRQGLSSTQWFALELMRYFVRLSTSVHIFYASGSSSVDWRLNVLAMQN